MYSAQNCHNKNLNYFSFSFNELKYIFLDSTKIKCVRLRTSSKSQLIIYNREVFAIQINGFGLKKVKNSLSSRV